MPFTLSKVSTESEFAEVVACEWAAYKTPYNAIFSLFFPVFSSSENARREAYEESLARQLEWQRTDPTSEWIMVRDNDTGEVAGGALWHFHETCPPPGPPAEEITCDWWPEGPMRAIADQMMVQFVGAKSFYVKQPHGRESLGHYSQALQWFFIVVVMW